MNDRPVMIVATDDGGADCVVLDWQTGSFVPDRTYFSRTVPDEFGDVDAVTAQAMDEVVADLRAGIVARIAHRLADRAAGRQPDGHDEAERTPPFDADGVESLDDSGLVAHAPKLLVRWRLDAQLGAPDVRLRADGAVDAVYSVGTGHPVCSVIVEFPSAGPDATATTIRFVLAR